MHYPNEFINAIYTRNRLLKVIFLLNITPKA